MLYTQWHGNIVLMWLIAAALFILATLALVGLRAFIRRRGTSRSAGDSIEFLRASETLLSRLAKHTHSVFLAVIGLRISATVLDLPTDELSWLTRGAIIVVIIQLGVWGTVIAQFLIAWIFDPQRRRENDRATTGIIQFVANLVVWSVVLIVGLENLGWDVSAVLAGLGVGGIALALATQTLLGDMIASISLVLDEPFKAGDFVIIGDRPGTVLHVGVRTTRIRALSGELLIISNNDLLKSRIQNFADLQERRVVFHFGVEYSTPSAQLRDIPGWVRAAIEARDQVRFDRCHFQTFGESELRFETVYFVLNPDYAVFMAIQHEINLGLCERLEQEGVHFAFPTRTLKGLEALSQGGESG